MGEARLVDIHVEPFAEPPYLCKADSEHVLQKGRMYVRTTGKAETGATPRIMSFASLSTVLRRNGSARCSPCFLVKVASLPRREI